MSYKPNGSILIAGEDVPNDQALFSRLIDINLQTCPPDIPVSNEQLAPYKDTMSYLYYRIIEKDLPSVAMLELGHKECKAIIKEYMDSIGISRMSDRDMDNWSVILYMLKTEVLPYIKGVKMESILHHIGEKIMEKAHLQKERDPVNVVFEYAKTLIGNEKEPIEAFVTVEYNPAFAYKGYIYIRDRALVSSYIESVSRENRSDLTIAAILGYLRALNQDIMLLRDPKDKRVAKDESNPRAYFTVNGGKQRHRCLRFKFECGSDALRELRNAIQGDHEAGEDKVVR